tara:strand:- start:308 stop:514 length:207 start_codon:yes stop_codon:yes gene_type:complete
MFKNLKEWFNGLIVKQIFNSKKFWYMVSSVVVPIIITYLGVDEETAKNLFYALLTLILGQGIADSAKK